MESKGQGVGAETAQAGSILLMLLSPFCLSSSGPPRHHRAVSRSTPSCPSADALGLGLQRHRGKRSVDMYQQQRADPTQILIVPSSREGRPPCRFSASVRRGQRIPNNGRSEVQNPRLAIEGAGQRSEQQFRPALVQAACGRQPETVKVRGQRRKSQRIEGRLTQAIKIQQRALYCTISPLLGARCPSRLKLLG